MSQMKTLKQLMEIHALEYKGFTVDIAIHCTKEWLKQKRLPAIDLMTTWNMTIDELLGEIKE